MRRVVVTGMGGHLPARPRLADAFARAARAAQRRHRACPSGRGTRACTRASARRVADFELPAHYPRKSTRSMGRVALLATRATELALDDAGLLGDPLLTTGAHGIAYGSPAGSPPAIGDLRATCSAQRHRQGINATTTTSSS